ncbi:uncharacterized protein LOC111362477 [Spodoptera litura]|uniref:Uncharacterized protein LOC111362477 n=1 Tax=Spodoptera litura TaxID=69820 RepID=A0A9J7EU32_SPOLT|nr:uncharacterized protein LOC111362477 [Spodoptera litura]
MCCKGIFLFCLVAAVFQKTTCLPLGYQGAISPCNQLIPESIAGSPIITEIVPSLQFGDITVSGDLPIGGSIKVKGVFPVYGTVTLDGALPSSGSAVVNTGCGVVSQVV